MLSQVFFSGLSADSFQRRVHHAVDHDLSHSVSAKVNRFELDELLMDLRVEVVKIQITSSHAAFTKKTL